ncbi:MAG: FAD-binding oxidoreductase [Pseudomonadota bacterium]
MSQITIVGAGVVGLACAWSAQRNGWKVTIIDRDFEGDRASHGNAGGIAVSESTPMAISGFSLKAVKWLLDPLGPLSIRIQHAPKLIPWFLAFNQVNKIENYRKLSHALASLNNRALNDLQPMLRDLGLAGELHHRGALSVYETDKAFEEDAVEWNWKRQLGVRWRAVDADELRNLEPGLAPVFRHGIMIEDWAHVNDPKTIVDTLRNRIRALGAKFVTAEITKLDASNPQKPAAISADGTRYESERLLVTSGAWSAKLTASIGDKILLESERGYNTTLPASAQKLNREVIFAERKFVATPLAIGLRIGGAAEFAGLEAPANYQRSEALLSLARRFIPGLDESGGKQWMGHRPATPDSIPVLGASPKSPNILYAFGHGHLGLTQAATTAALITDLLAGRTPGTDLSPFSIQRFSAHQPN